MINLGKLAVIWRVALRPQVLHPRSAMLSVASITMGVAVFLSITIANRSAVESFSNAFAQITGKADLELRGELPEEILPLVQGDSGVAAATPLIESMVTLPDFPGESLRLVGIDPFTAGSFLAIKPEFAQGDQGGLSEWLGDKPVIAAGKAFLQRHHLERGAEVRLLGSGAPKKVRLGFEIGNDTADVDGHVAAMDIAAAQEWLGSRGKLNAILISLKHKEDQQVVADRLKKIIPQGAIIEPPARRTKQVEIMLSAFRMNLTALSLVSLLVGIFFVANTAAAAVIRNRISLGILRAIGMGRESILWLTLIEAAFCGMVGSMLGIVLAPLLASFLAAPVAQTVTALYLPVFSRAGWPTPGEAFAGMVAGVGASLLAAIIPARAASAVDPTRVLHPGAAPEIFTVPTFKLALGGVVFLGGAALSSMGALHGWALLGFAAAFLLLLGCSLFVPLVMQLAATLMRRSRLLNHPVIRMAVVQVIRSIHRTAPTIAALAAAVAMMVGISVMIYSFRGSVIAWTNKTLTADLFIAPAANELLGLAHTLPEGAAAWWGARPEVKEVGTFREYEVRSIHDEQVTLGVVSGPARGNIDFLHGGGERKTQALFRGEGVVLSESLARRLKLSPGDTLSVQSPCGTISLRVLDLYRDYTRDRGTALIGAERFREVWGDQGIHSLAIEFCPGIPQEKIESINASFKKAFGGSEAFACYSNRTLKARIVEIFNQTFAVTSVLRTISIAVAIGGVMLTLGMLVMERTRELGVLRSMGASENQILRMILAEATMIGLLASGVGMVSGAGLALVLTWVINKAFFGWSIDLSFPWWELASIPIWMTGSALLAGLLPARKAAKIPPARALRME
jgi:putative ABC transport system permease protein